MIEQGNFEELSLTGSRKSDMSKDKFLSSQKLSEQIEKIVLEKSLNYFDAMLYFCEETGIEPNEISQYVCGALKQKIQDDAIEMGYLPKKTTVNMFEE